MPLLHVGAAILVALIWGANFVISKVGMETFPPFFYSLLRFSLLACILLPFAPRPPRDKWLGIATIALLLCVGNMAGLLLALEMGLNIPGAVIVAQMGVPFSCLLGIFFYRDVLGKWRILGLIISFIGIIMIAGEPNALNYPLAFVVALLAALAWAFANILIKRLGTLPITTFLAYESLLAVPMLAVIIAASEDISTQMMLNAPAVAWAALLFSSLFSMWIAYGLWAWLLRIHSVSSVAPYALLTPVFGIALGQLVYKDNLTPELIVGGILTMVGVAIITYRRPRLKTLGERV